MVVIISVSHLLAKIPLNWSYTRLEQSSLAKQYGGCGRAQTLTEHNHPGKMDVFRLRHLDDHKASHQHSYGKVSSSCIHHFAVISGFIFQHTIIATSLEEIKHQKLQSKHEKNLNKKCTNAASLHNTFPFPKDGHRTRSCSSAKGTWQVMGLHEASCRWSG